MGSAGRRARSSSHAVLAHAARALQPAQLQQLPAVRAGPGRGAAGGGAGRAAGRRRSVGAPGPPGPRRAPFPALCPLRTDRDLSPEPRLGTGRRTPAGPAARCWGPGLRSPVPGRARGAHLRAAPTPCARPPLPVSLPLALEGCLPPGLCPSARPSEPLARRRVLSPPRGERRPRTWPHGPGGGSGGARRPLAPGLVHRGPRLAPASPLTEGSLLQGSDSRSSEGGVSAARARSSRPSLKEAARGPEGPRRRAARRFPFPSSPRRP